MLSGPDCYHVYEIEKQSSSKSNEPLCAYTNDNEMPKSQIKLL